MQSHGRTDDEDDPESAIPFEVLQRVSQQARSRGFARRSPQNQVPAAGVDRLSEMAMGSVGATAKPSNTYEVPESAMAASSVGQPLEQIPEGSRLHNSEWDDDDDDDGESSGHERYQRSTGYDDDEEEEEEEEDSEEDDNEEMIEGDIETNNEGHEEEDKEEDKEDMNRPAQTHSGLLARPLNPTFPETRDQAEAFSDSPPGEPKSSAPPKVPRTQQGQQSKPSIQSAGTPTGVQNAQDIDLRELQFLPSLSKRGNRMGYYRQQLVELHVIKLRDLPSTARYAEEYSSTLRWLQHENITAIKGISKRKENLFVVATSFVEFTLQELLNTASEIPYPFVLRFAFQLCSALMYLHQNKLAHYNIHAHTVFMDSAQPPNLRLLDTGVGRAYKGSPFAVGNNHAILLAPELRTDVSRRRENDAIDGFPIDVYHFAHVLWEMLAGVNAADITNTMTSKSKMRMAEKRAANMSVASSAATSETDSIEGERLHREITQNVRPPLLAVPPEFRSLLAQSWAQDPSQRPHINELIKYIKRLILATRQPFEPLRFFSSQPGLNAQNLPICTSKAVRLRRLARMNGKEILKLQVNICVLQETTQGETRDVDLSGILDGQTIIFRKKCAVNLPTLGLWRVESLLTTSETDTATDKPEQILRHCEMIRTRFSSCPGLCMPHNFRRAQRQAASLDSLDNMHANKGMVLLDYVNGISLQDILDRGGCADEHFLARVAWGILQGLGWLHRFGQTHGALCPRNIILDRSGNVHLSGLQVSPSSVAVRMEEIWRSEQLDYGFIAPEVLLGNARDLRGDIWSFGMCMWACASGKAPLTHVTNFEAARDYASSYSMTPNLEQDIVSERFRKFVRRCILSLREERPQCDDLLLDEFLMDYIDYQPYSIGSGSNMVFVDPDEGNLTEEISDTISPLTTTRANIRLERLIVRQEIAHLSSQVRQAFTRDQLSALDPVVGKFAHTLTCLPSDHVVRLLAGLWGPGGSNQPSLAGAQYVDTDLSTIKDETSRALNLIVSHLAPTEELDHEGEDYQTESSSALPTSEIEAMLMGLDWNILLVIGEPAQNDYLAWPNDLAKVLRRQNMIGLPQARLEDHGIFDILAKTHVPRLIVLEARTDGLETLFSVSASLKSDADLFILAARPHEHIVDARGDNISRTGFAEAVLARLALMYLLLARQGTSILHERGDPVLYTLASFGHKREPYKKLKNRYDVFVGCPLENDGDAQAASQVIVSWLATKPSELTLAWARHDDAENVGQFLERLITLELASSVLFYVFPADARAYSSMVRAIAHAVCGKPVIAVFGPLQDDHPAAADVRRARTLFHKHVDYLVGDTVHIFDTVNMDEATELAISISTLHDASFLESLEGLNEEAKSSTPPLSEGGLGESPDRVDAFSSSVQKLAEVWDEARVLEDLDESKKMDNASWIIPQGLRFELESASRLVQNTLASISGVNVGCEPPSFADPNLEVAVQALPNAFDRSTSPGLDNDSSSDR